MDKNQLEKEGWIDEYGNGVTFTKKHPDGSHHYAKFWNGDDPEAMLIMKFTPSKPNETWSMSCRECVFNGYCTDITTFKLICNLLRI